MGQIEAARRLLIFPADITMLGGMRIAWLFLAVALVTVFAVRETQAQRRGQKSGRGERSAPPQQPAAPAQPPANPALPGTSAPAAQLKFKDLAVDSTFFFLSDTNRAYPWVKTSDTTARNTVNTNVATITGQTPVKR